MMMEIIPLDAINDDDVHLRQHHPTAKWVIGWRWRTGNSIANEKRVREIATRICKHPFHMRDMYTYIAFDDHEDATLTYLALC